ncbi:DUF1959 family protein [Methanocaldococcus indicus]|uniref:DUF1959 family protein n=1 Tax=Methanocaldococcus indicus TaxID=213231 RepID=UPI003C6D4165
MDIKDIDKKYLEDSFKQKINIVRDNRFLMDTVFIPIAKKLDLDVDEVISLFLNKHDFATVYELDAYAEQARMACLGRKVDIDLGLCWLTDFFRLISKRDADEIRKYVVELVVLRNMPYKEALKKGKEILLKKIYEDRK